MVSNLEQINFKEDWPDTFYAEDKCYKILVEKFYEKYKSDWQTYEKHGLAISEFMFNELHEFTRAFEVYCICFVNSCVEDFSDKQNVRNISSEMFSLKKAIISELRRYKESAQKAHDDSLKKHFTPQTEYSEQTLAQIYEMDKQLRSCIHR